MSSLEKASRKARKLGLTDGCVTFGLCCDTGEADCASRSEMKAAWKHLKAAVKKRRQQGQAVAAVKLQCVDVCSQGPIGFCSDSNGTRWYGRCDPDGVDAVLAHHLDNGHRPDERSLKTD